VSSAVCVIAAEVMEELQSFVGPVRMGPVTLDLVVQLLALVEVFTKNHTNLNFHLHVSGYDTLVDIFWLPICEDASVRKNPSPARLMLGMVYRYMESADSMTASARALLSLRPALPVLSAGSPRLGDQLAGLDVEDTEREDLRRRACIRRGGAEGVPGALTAPRSAAPGAPVGARGFGGSGSASVMAGVVAPGAGARCAAASVPPVTAADVAVAADLARAQAAAANAIFPNEDDDQDGGAAATAAAAATAEPAGTAAAARDNGGSDDQDAGSRSSGGSTRVWSRRRRRVGGHLRRRWTPTAPIMDHRPADYISTDEAKDVMNLMVDTTTDRLTRLQMALTKRNAAVAAGLCTRWRRLCVPWWPRQSTQDSPWPLRVIVDKALLVAAGAKDGTRITTGTVRAVLPHATLERRSTVAQRLAEFLILADKSMEAHLEMSTFISGVAPTPRLTGAARAPLLGALAPLRAAPRIAPTSAQYAVQQADLRRPGDKLSGGVVRPPGWVPIGSPRPTHHKRPGPEELPAPLPADHPAATRAAMAATAALSSMGGSAPATSQSVKIRAALKARAAGKATAGSSTRPRPASSASASAGDSAGGTSLTPASSPAQGTQSSLSTTASRPSPSARGRPPTSGSTRTAAGAAASSTAPAAPVARARSPSAPQGAATAETPRGKLVPPAAANSATHCRPSVPPNGAPAHPPRRPSETPAVASTAPPRRSSALPGAVPGAAPAAPPLRPSGPPAAAPSAPPRRL